MVKTSAKDDLSDAYTVSSSDDEPESILDYFDIFGLKIEDGFTFYIKRVLQCLRWLQEHKNLNGFGNSKGIVCKKCHDSYLKKYNPADCVCFSVMEHFIDAGVAYLGCPPENRYISDRCIGSQSTVIQIREMFLF